MASRVNKRFVIILGTVLVILAGGVAAIGYAVLTKSGADYERLGDAAMTRGEYRDARRFYSKAVNHDDTNDAWLSKWRQAVLSDIPETQVEYRAAYNEYLMILMQSVLNDPTDVEVNHEFLNELYQPMRSMAFSRERFQSLISRTEDTLAHFEGTDAGDALRRYRGLARARMATERLRLSDEEQSLAEADLLAALAADPADAESADGLATLLLTRSDRERAEGRPDQADQTFEEARAVLAGFLEDNPGDPLVSVSLLQFDVINRSSELMQGSSASDRVAAAELIRAEFSERVDSLTNALVAADPGRVDTVLVSRFAPIAGSLGTSDGRGATRVLDAAISKRPNAADLRLLKAILLTDRGGYEAALDELDTITSMPHQTVSLKGIMLFDYQARARVQQCEAAALRWAALGDNEGADEALARAKRYRDALAEEIPEDTAVLKLVDARLALAENDVARAQNLITEYNLAVGDVDPKGLWMQAQVAINRGQLGVARDSLRKVIVLQPRNAQAYERLADVNAQLEDYEAAINACTIALEINPDNERLKERLRTFEVITNRREASDPVVAALITARNLADDGQTDDAIELLLNAAEASGHDPRLAMQLARLLSMRGQREQALEAVTRALERHPDDANLQNLQRMLGESDPVEGAIASIPQDTPEIDRLTQEARIYKVYGRDDRAAESLAKARAIDPENRGVVELSFIEAIETDNLDEADRLAGVAASQNLDNANGLSFRAELLRARGDLRGAVGAMTQAVELYSTDPIMWRRLGRIYSEAGRAQDAIEAYEHALDMKPDDVNTIIPFIDTLRRLGKSGDALALARASEAYGRGNSRFFDLWMTLEAETGDRALAMHERAQMYENVPDDIVNAYELAMLEIQDRRFDEVDRIIEDLAARDDVPAIRTVRLRAERHAARGDMDSARLAFVEHILDLDDPGIGPYLSFAAFMFEKGEITTGAQALEEARSYQSDETMEADRMLGEALSRYGAPELAIDPLRRIVDGGADTPEQSYRLMLAEALQRERRFDEADEVLAAFSDADRKNTLSLRLLEIQGWINRRETDRALDLLNAATADFPDAATVFFNRAALLRSIPGREEDAIADLERVIELEPTRWQAFELRASINARRERQDDAIRDFRQVLRLNPGYQSLRQRLILSLCEMDRADEAVAVADELIEQNPSDINVVLEMARMFESRGLWRRAGGYYARAWELQKFPALCQWYVEALVSADPPSLRRADQVMAEFEDEVEADAGLLVTRARIAGVRGDYAATARDCTAAYALLASHPERSPAWFSSVSRALGGDDERVLTYLGLLEQETDRPDWVSLFRAQVEARDARKRDQAESRLRRLTEDATDALPHAAAFKALASLYYAQDRKQDAADAWKAGLGVIPDDWEMTNNLAYVLAVDLDRPEDALPYAERSVSLNPRSPDTYDTLGQVYRKLGRLDDAAQALGAALSGVAPGSPRAASMHVALAEIHLERDDVEAAAAQADQLRQIVEVNPSVESYKPDLDRLNALIQSRR